jgi:hypothetical protein
MLGGIGMSHSDEKQKSFSDLPRYTASNAYFGARDPLKENSQWLLDRD